MFKVNIYYHSLKWKKHFFWNIIFNYRQCLISVILFFPFFCLVFGIKSIENVFIINESKPVDKECFKNGILCNEWRHLSYILTEKTCCRKLLHDNRLGGDGKLFRYYSFSHFSPLKWSCSIELTQQKRKKPEPHCVLVGFSSELN